LKIWGSIISRDSRFFIFPKCRDWFKGPCSLLCSGYWWLFPWACIKLTLTSV